MKQKITISLNEDILAKIDRDVKILKWKNRSQIIENTLKYKYWKFSDITVIVFCHDYKWSDGPYPYREPKSLLKIKWESIIKEQISIFEWAWITSVILTIPFRTGDLFKKELLLNFKKINFTFIEMNSDVLTWDALRKVLKNSNINENLIISNWDIYYWDLNLEDYYGYHLDQKWDFSFLLKFVSDPLLLWNVWVSWNRVISFVEKSSTNKLLLTNSWLYITTKNFLKKSNLWHSLEYDFFTKLPNIANVIWYIYSWLWEYIQSEEVYKRINNF
jgi:NDP-sugar pyrophosphorylase family protein